MLLQDSITSRVLLVLTASLQTNASPVERKNQEHDEGQNRDQAGNKPDI